MIAVRKCQMHKIRGMSMDWKTILHKGTKYSELYAIMDNAFRSESPIPMWYENELVSNL